jgi:trehalose synthase
MTTLLQQYAEIAGSDVVEQIQQLAHPLRGLKVLHVNSTKEGGGVAEILHKLVPLQQEIGLEAEWVTITGGSEFYSCTKLFHNALQGNSLNPTESQLEEFKETNRQFAEEYREKLDEADIVVIHDPQPCFAIEHSPERRGKWIWRCHIDLRTPFRPVWRFLRNQINNYDASVFSLPEFSPRLPHPQFIIPPSIDPLSEKNMELPLEEVSATFAQFNLNAELPMVLQVSRFDRFKDPVGVIEAYRLAKNFSPLQLVLAGGGASDDPEGSAVLEEVRKAAGDDPDIHVLLLPSDAHRTINALQRSSDFIMQKSLKEGFGLTVTEALWKGKPVVGGDVGGIRLQIVDHITGFLVRSVEGAAMRIRYLLHNHEKMEKMGVNARRFARDNFLLTRHLRDYLVLFHVVLNGRSDRIRLEDTGDR